jgi:hypothetical protein
MDEEAPLNRQRLYRGPQQAALVFYVPLAVFVVEAMILFVALRVIGIYAVAILPAHIVPVILTRANPEWVRDLVQDIRYRWFNPAKGLFGAHIITYTPQRMRRRYDKRAL